jgi:hypothetical protein
LFGLLVAFYFLTYSGEPSSTDELVLFDGVHSFAQNGTLELAYTHDTRPYLTQPNNNIVIWLDVEPMQAYLAAPLLFVARYLPGVGLVQATWLFNILVTALTAVVVFYYGILLGYQDRTALGVALLFGLATIAWPYSRLFFREPLWALFVLVAAYALERWRRGISLAPRPSPPAPQGVTTNILHTSHADDSKSVRLPLSAKRRGGRGVRFISVPLLAGEGFRVRAVWLLWLLSALGALAGAVFTKEATILIAPTLLVVALPDMSRRLFHRRTMFALLMLGGLAAAAFIVYQLLTPVGRVDLLDRVRSMNLAYFQEAFPAYVLSPGFSLWAFSPVLLLGIGGAIILWRKHEWRQFLVPFVMAASIVLGYSLLRGGDWYGGKGWGPRYLLPITPFLALWLLPVVEKLLTRQVRPWLRGIAAGVIVYSIFVQVIGLIVPVKAFGTYLYNEDVSLSQWALSNSAWNLNQIPAIRLAQVLAPWIDGVWNPLYLPQVVNAHQSGSPSPIAWVVNDSGVLVVPLCLLAGAIAFRAIVHCPASRRERWLSFGVIPLSMALMLYVGLRTFYQDVRFTDNNPVLWTVLDRLNAEIRPGDAVILNDAAYRNFFMNTYRRRQPIYLMPLAEGERLELDKPPKVRTGNPEERIHPYTTELLARLSQNTSRWWFVTQFGPFSQGRLRPVEHYLVRHYFTGREVISDSSVRLITLSPTNAPPDWIPPWPAYRVNADFGAGWLVGFDLPAGEVIRRGTPMLPVALLWRHEGWPADLPPFDYSINVSLINRDGVVVTPERGVQPVGGFAPMMQWANGGYYRDNHALELPLDLPSGEYELWVKIFDWRNGAPLAVRNAAGNAPKDHVVIAKIKITG